MSNWVNSNSVGELPVWWEMLRLLALADYGAYLVRLASLDMRRRVRAVEHRRSRLRRGRS